jgi:hypothetical protein
MPQYANQVTLQYSLFLKRAIVEALQAGFAGYTGNDPASKTIAQARVAVDFDERRWALPGVIVKFNDSNVNNIGLGHQEWLDSPQDNDPDNPTLFIKYYQRLYNGEVVFDVWGQSSVDRDIVRDALIEILGMADVTDEGNDFLNRFYNDQSNTPYGVWNYPVLITNIINGLGESTELAPWQPEDTLVYKVSYSIPIIGEFYSKTPVLPSGTGFVQEVDVYPWVVGIDPTPQENPDTPDNPDWYRFAGWKNTTEVI